MAHLLLQLRPQAAVPPLQLVHRSLKAAHVPHVARPAAQYSKAEHSTVSSSRQASAGACHPQQGWMCREAIAVPGGLTVPVQRCSDCTWHTLSSAQSPCSAWLMAGGPTTPAPVVPPRPYSAAPLHGSHPGTAVPPHPHTACPWQTLGGARCTVLDPTNWCLARQPPAPIFMLTNSSLHLTYRTTHKPGPGPAGPCTPLYTCVRTGCVHLDLAAVWRLRNLRTSALAASGSWVLCRRCGGRAVLPLSGQAAGGAAATYGACHNAAHGGALRAGDLVPASATRT